MREDTEVKGKREKSRHQVTNGNRWVLTYFLKEALVEMPLVMAGEFAPVPDMRGLNVKMPCHQFEGRCQWMIGSCSQMVCRW